MVKWERVDLEKWSKSAGIDLHEIDQKLRLREIIINSRLRLGLTQSELARIVGISRSRIAQIESGIKLDKMSFDVLLRILQRLGYRYQITAKRAA